MSQVYTLSWHIKNKKSCMHLVFTSNLYFWKTFSNKKKKSKSVKWWLSVFWWRSSEAERECLRRTYFYCISCKMVDWNLPFFLSHRHAKLAHLTTVDWTSRVLQCYSCDQHHDTTFHHENIHSLSTPSCLHVPSPKNDTTPEWKSIHFCFQWASKKIKIAILLRNKTPQTQCGTSA